MIRTALAIGVNLMGLVWPCFAYAADKPAVPPPPPEKDSDYYVAYTEQVRAGTNGLYWTEIANREEAAQRRTRNWTIGLAIVALALPTLPRSFELKLKRWQKGLIDAGGLAILFVSLLVLFNDNSEYAEASLAEKRWNLLETEARTLFQHYAEIPDKEFKIRTAAVVDQDKAIEATEPHGYDEELMRSCENKYLHSLGVDTAQPIAGK
jgi:hypothetical protein